MRLSVICTFLSQTHCAAMVTCSYGPHDTGPHGMAIYATKLGANILTTSHVHMCSYILVLDHTPRQAAQGRPVFLRYGVSAGLTRQHCRNGSVAARLQKLAEEAVGIAKTFSHLLPLRGTSNLLCVVDKNLLQLGWIKLFYEYWDK